MYKRKSSILSTRLIKGVKESLKTVQNICSDMHAWEGKNKNHDENINLTACMQVPFPASVSERYRYTRSETNALFQTGKCQTEASIDTLKEDIP